MIGRILILISIVISSNVVAQGTDSNSISLSVVLPDNSEYLTSRSVSKIETKIQHIVSRNGISGRGYTNEFLIYPKFEIFNESIVEGMRSIVVVEVEFSLFIQQYSTRKVFSSYSKSLKGSGFSKEKAIVNAISKISSSDTKLKDFIITGKEKIISYYENNCTQIVGDSDALIKMKKYGQAIALLSSIPKEAKKCYNSIQQKTIEAYNAYQEQTCRQNILGAKAKLADNNYSGALYTLGLIDPSSSCSKEAEKLIREFVAKMEKMEKESIVRADKQEKKEWNFMLRQHTDRVDMEKYRLGITKEIAKAYYKSKPQTVIYKSLF